MKRRLLKPKFQYLFLIFPNSFIIVGVFAVINYVLANRKDLAFQMFKIAVIGAAAILYVIPALFKYVLHFDMGSTVWNILYTYIINIPLSFYIIIKQEQFFAKHINNKVM